MINRTHRLLTNVTILWLIACNCLLYVNTAQGQEPQKKNIVKDFFDDNSYKANSPLSGLNGGAGWKGPWTGDAPGITIQQPDADVKNSPNKIVLKSAGTAQQVYRDMASPWGTDGATAWISFIFQKLNGNASAGFYCYGGGNTKLFIGVPAGKNVLALNSTLTNISALNAHQIFVRIDFHKTGDIAYLFIDPSLASNPDVEGANATIKRNFAYDRIGLGIGAGGNTAASQVSLGQVLIAGSFADVVTPLPGGKAEGKDIGARLKVLSWNKQNDGLYITTSGGILKLQPFLNNVLNVRFGALKKIKAAKSFAVSRKPDVIAFNVKENADELILNTAVYSARVSKVSGQLRLFDASGKLLMQEAPGGGRNALIGDSVMVADKFKLNNNEALYGLGQFRDGALNLRGKRRELVQVNTQAAIPVLLSTNGWGMFWDNPSRTVFEDGDNGMQFSSDFGSTLSYYLFVGPRLDSLVSAYRNLTGIAPMIPRWAFGYHQSRNKYATQDQVLQTAQRMRNENIPFSSIFIDYYYWGKYGTGSHRFDETLFPDLAGMMRKLHQDMHVKVVATVWPTFKPGTPNADAMSTGGYLLDGVRALDGTVYDPFNPKAAELYWHQVATQLVPTGIDGWFLDGPEPDNTTSFLKANTYLGPAPTVRNLYPLFHSTTFYNGLLSLQPNIRPYLLTRCAWASQQKNGTVIWSGDIESTFAELKKQITAGLNFTAAGIPYWTTDIGGYSGGDPNDARYREVFTRWWQYGVFCPVFRSHGRRYPGDTKGPNELWAFGPEVQKIGTDYDNLRYRLLPYIYSLAGKVTLGNYTPMRVLAFDFGTDKAVYDIKDQFMYGPALMACPVTEAGAIDRKVYLPKGANWLNFWTGEKNQGGTTITAAAPLAQMPLFVKCGSIIPMGPLQQYVDEQKADPLEIRVYPGANGQFELYEDDGSTYDYKKGQCSRITFMWNDSAKTLTIGKRQGSFKGMPVDRQFRIVLVSPTKGTGIYPAAGDVISVSYSGDVKKIQCSK